MYKRQADIYAMMDDMRKRGKSIIMISEEIMELLGMADRILIMKDGKICLLYTSFWKTVNTRHCFPGNCTGSQHPRLMYPARIDVYKRQI